LMQEFQIFVNHWLSSSTNWEGFQIIGISTLETHREHLCEFK
jgi:hypothetical protein